MSADIPSALLLKSINNSSQLLSGFTAAASVCARASQATRNGILRFGLLTATHAHQRRDPMRRWRNWQTH